MHKIKSIHLLLIMTTLLLAPLVVSRQVYAAPAGCYRSLPNGTYESTACNSTQQAIISDGGCTVDGTPRSCESITVSGEESADALPPVEPIELETDCEPPKGTPLSAENCAIIAYLVTGINFLSALAGMAIVASIMIAGYQYMTARDNAGQIQKARTRIIWAITALLVFIFMYAALNFLVPGGVL